MSDAPDLGADGPAAASRHTFDATIPGTRRIVARAVASEPLDHYAANGSLSEVEYDAGKRVRALLAVKWPHGRCTAPARYVSTASDYDDEGDRPADEDRHEAWLAACAMLDDAAAQVGRHDWPSVAAVCEGYWLARLGEFARLRRGLAVLARVWGR